MKLDLDWANIQQILIIVGAFAATFTILFTIKRLIWRRLRKWTEAGRPAWYGLLLKEIQKPINVMLLTISFGIALQVAPPFLRDHPLPATASRILLILALFWLVDRAISVSIRSGNFSKKLTETTKNIVIEYHPNRDHRLFGHDRS